jgi:hypothetical protein
VVVVVVVVVAMLTWATRAALGGGLIGRGGARQAGGRRPIPPGTPAIWTACGKEGGLSLCA